MDIYKAINKKIRDEIAAKAKEQLEREEYTNSVSKNVANEVLEKLEKEDFTVTRYLSSAVIGIKLNKTVIGTDITNVSVIEEHTKNVLVSQGLIMYDKSVRPVKVSIAANTVEIEISSDGILPIC